MRSEERLGCSGRFPLSTREPGLEVEYVLSLVEKDDKGMIDVLKFADALMDTRPG